MMIAIFAIVSTILMIARDGYLLEFASSGNTSNAAQTTDQYVYYALFNDTLLRAERCKKNALSTLKSNKFGSLNITTFRP